MERYIALAWQEFKAWWTEERIEYAVENVGPVAAWFLAGFFVAYICLNFFFGWLFGQPLSFGPALLFVIPPSIYVGVEAVLHSYGLFGRQFKPRMWIWWALAIALISIILFSLVILTLGDLGALNDYAQVIGIEKSGHNFWLSPELIWQTMTASPTSKSIGFRLYLNGLAFVAGVTLVLFTPMPSNWALFRRFQFFLLALIVVCGRPVAGDLYAELAILAPGPGLDLLRVLLAPIVMAFAGVLTLGFAVLLVGVTVLLAFFVFVLLPLLIFDFLEKREEKAQINAYKKAGLENYLWRFDAWLRHDKSPPLPDDSKGARFLAPDEIEAVRRKSGFGLGHIDGKTLYLNTDKHVLLMASTRSGKGVTVIIPHLLRYPGSAFVLDPKGENARATGRCRSTLNDTVHYLDPFGISGLPQARFNPLASFTHENMEANSKALAGALVLSDQRDHWTASGQQLIAAIILHVVTSKDFPPTMKDLVTVRRLLLGGIKPTLESMAKNGAAGGLVADLAASFLNTPEKELGSIISTAQRETEILDNPYIAACLLAAGSGKEVDFSEWHRGTMTVYLCLSAPKFPVFNRWLRLVLTSALDGMTDQLNPPAMPVCFMLDELATLGHLGVIENAIGLAAGYGIQLIAVFQDIAQMKDLYKGRWASFIGNAGIRALFSLDDLDTARYWSDFMGNHMVNTLSQSQDIYGLTKGQTAGEAQRPLLTPEQIMLRYATDRMLILKQGSRPIEAARVPYWHDRTLTGLWDDPRLQPDTPARRPSS